MRQNQPCLELGPSKDNGQCKDPEAGLQAGYDPGRSQHFRGGVLKGPLQTEASSDPEGGALSLHPAQVPCDGLLRVAGSNCLFPDVSLDFLDLEVMPCGYLYGRL